jgi:protein tyrosine phosphatase (PTP) superfamily phosphohydrolase (DUF442 family)
MNTMPFTVYGFVIVSLLMTGCVDGRKADSESAADVSSKESEIEVVCETDKLEQPVETVEGTPKAENLALPHRLTSAHLPNAIQIHEKVISGGQPEGAEAFQELQNLGIRTIISVDGAKPDLELAKRHGLKYVHLPHSYDGIPEQRGKELAKAVRDFEGPIYIHCHHGKHRSPAAAAVACVTAGLIDPSVSSVILKLAGANPNYRGLYESAESAQKVGDAVLDALKCDFPESAELTPMAESMVHLEQTFDSVKTVAAAGWKSPLSRPDLHPVQEVLLLKDHFSELLRTESVAKEPEGFRNMLRESESAAADLEAALMSWSESEAALPVPDTLPTSFERIAKNCVACHTEFRDVPLSEKQR